MPTPYYDHAGITMYCANCLDILLHLPKVDLVLTDPPYGCGKAVWDQIYPTEWYGLIQARMVAIITGSCGIKESVRLVGDDFVDVISGRNLNGMTRGPIGFGNWLAAVIAKGKPQQGTNAFDFTVDGEMPSHPCPKPITYMRRLVERLTVPEALILDPFMGSGTTLVAAKQLGRRAIGIEIEEKYCEIAVKRLAQEQLPLEPETPRTDEQMALLGWQDEIKEEVLGAEE